MNKRLLYQIIAVVLIPVFVGVLFLPVFKIYVEPTYFGGKGYELVNIVTFFAHTDVIKIVALCIGLTIMAIGALFLALSIRKDPENKPDRSDFYIFTGNLLVICGGIVNAFVSVSAESYIVLAMSLVYSGIYFLFVYIHNKYFCLQ